MTSSLSKSRSFSIPISSLDGTISVPKFDPDWGDLTGIIVSGIAEHTLNLKAENENADDTASVLWGDTFVIESALTINTPLDVLLGDNGVIWQPFTVELGVYDETTDFSGSSGRTIELQVGQGFTFGLVTAAGALTEMTGASGNPGSATCLVHRTLTLQVSAETDGEEGDVAIAYEHHIGASQVTITYLYDLAS